MIDVKKRDHGQGMREREKREWEVGMKSASKKETKRLGCRIDGGDDGVTGSSCDSPVDHSITHRRCGRMLTENEIRMYL
jgi:hypothetical protein